tara:strand:- start:2 stop:1999 length:1998 start_codon:yes stop_codon:yes gene_type:complete
MSASFAHVLCTTSSAVDAIAASALPVFDSDHDDVVFSENTSDDITYTATAGTFTFAKAGTYHVVLTLVTSQETSDRLQTTTFELNSDGVIYSAAPFIDFAMDPTETTHQRIITVAAADVLNIETTTPGHTMGIVKGTSVIITEITSGVFASSTVTTAGSNNTTDAFNPFDTDGDGPAFAAAGLIASGVTFAGAAGSMTVPSAGKYLIMINHMFAAGGSTNSNITMLLVRTRDSTDSTLLSNAVRLHSTVDPTEHTMCVIEDLAASDVLTVSYDIGAGRCQAELGATFTVYKLEEGSTGLYPPTRRGQDLYACVVMQRQTLAAATEINPFEASKLLGAESAVQVADGDAANGLTEKQHITLTSTDGTVKRYVLTNAASDGATATGTVLSDSGDTDTGAGTAGADEDGGVAVSLNLSSGTQNAYLVQLKAAIEHANGHNGKITVSAVPGQANGAQTITLTQAVAGAAGNTTTTENLATVSKNNFSGGDKIYDTRSSNGITFASGAGTFTVSQDGLYFIMHNAIMRTASDVVFTSKIKVNGVVKVSSDTIHIDSLPDPSNATLSGFLSLKKDDIITVTIDANTSVNIFADLGSTLTIFRYYPFFTNESTATGLISDDLTINTFSQTNLSTQYDRNVDQVPFKFGIRGPGTLRGRGTNPSVVKGGDKKA